LTRMVGVEVSHAETHRMILDSVGVTRAWR
jgi:hypothetical protein